MYKATYRSVDGYRKYASFKTRKGAFNFIKRWCGNCYSPDLASPVGYFVATDGVGTVTVDRK